MRLGPDERVRNGDLRLVAQAYVYGHAREREYPSPVRWGWSSALALTARAAAWFALLAAVLTLAVSPLLIHLARLRLQDTAVAALSIASIMAAPWSPYTLAFAFAGLLSLKPESAALTVPAIAVASPTVATALALGVGGLVWSLTTAVAFGPRLAWGLAQAMRPGTYENEYGRTYQQGMWHRLLVDLALVSPVWIGAAIWYHPAALLPALVLLVTHAVTPVRNLRTVLAVDLLMRAALYSVLPVWVIIAGYACDAYLAWRGSKARLYDTPTNELVRAICFPVPR